MHLPDPRGPLSERVTTRLAAEDRVTRADVQAVRRTGALVDPLADADLQLALAVCFELHYRGFDDVDDGWEWDPGLLALRAELERPFEEAVREVSAPAARRALASTSDDERDGTPRVAAALQALVAADEGAPVSSYLMRHATLEEFRDFLAARSVYHLKEADPHTWLIPRVAGRAKSALVEVQSDEYGGGRPGRMHSELFAQTMRALGLDDTYGAYWGQASAETFATVNLMSLLGLHRRLRGLAVGHLAAFEMTSTQPNRRYGNGLRRLGFDGGATAFFDEHVEADAVHEQLAMVDLSGAFVASGQGTVKDALLGASAALALEARAGHALLASWAPASAGAA